MKREKEGYPFHKKRSRTETLKAPKVIVTGRGHPIKTGAGGIFVHFFLETENNE
jgi:hypothetical protein